MRDLIFTGGGNLESSSAKISKESLHFVPGTEVEWSRSNFLMLTEIVERVSGETYHDFVTERQIHFFLGCSERDLQRIWMDSAMKTYH